MQDFIVYDDSGSVVAKFRRHDAPDVPDGFSVEEVNSVDNYQIEEPVEWFP